MKTIVENIFLKQNKLECHEPTYFLPLSPQVMQGVSFLMSTVSLPALFSSTGLF